MIAAIKARTTRLQRKVNAWRVLRVLTLQTLAKQYVRVAPAGLIRQGLVRAPAWRAALGTMPLRQLALFAQLEPTLLHQGPANVPVVAQVLTHPELA